MVTHLVQSFDVEIEARSTDEFGKYLAEIESFKVSPLPRLRPSDANGQIDADRHIAHPPTKVGVNIRPARRQNVDGDAVQDALRPVSTQRDLAVRELAVLHQLVQFGDSLLRERRPHVAQSGWCGRLAEPKCR